MRGARTILLGLCCLATAACGSDDNGSPDEFDPLAYTAMSVGKTWDYQVDVGGASISGQVQVNLLDDDYGEGVSAYQVSLRENSLLKATRYYSLDEKGLYLLAEEVQEGTQVVNRTFKEPLKMLTLPLEDKNGIAVQWWSSESEMEEGGSETHRVDNSGRETVTVPAGTFEAFHLVRTRTDKDSQSHQYDEYFTPEVGYVQFSYPADHVWKLQ
jgi:hypothetical protein